MSKAKQVLLSLLFLSLNAAFLQAQSEKKQILLVPYPSVHFVSSFNLAELAEINSIEEPSKLYHVYLDSLIHVMALPHPKYSVFEISENDLQAIKFQVKIQYVDEPITHYGVSLEGGTMQNVQSIMDRMNADYVLFLNHCFIENKLYSSSRSFDGSYLIPWARHLIDYELYDKEGNLLVLADRFELTGNVPTQENYLSKGLHFGDLHLAYRSLLKDIVQKLKVHKAGGKPVYKYKVKKKKKAKQ